MHCLSKINGIEDWSMLMMKCGSLQETEVKPSPRTVLLSIPIPLGLSEIYVYPSDETIHAA